MQEKIGVISNILYVDFFLFERRRSTLNKGKVVLIVVAILVCVTIGFVAGQVVQAMSTLPGSSDDPVATESYVEATIGERLATLSAQVDELEAEVAALKGEAPPVNTNNNDTSTTIDNNDNTSGEQISITGNGVNLRSAASKDSEVLDTLAKGTKVTKLSEEGNWYKVRTSDGQVGYVSKDYAG